MAKANKEFTLEPGELWPRTPSGNRISIDLFGATGEFQSGKSILGGSIAPGVHPEGHPFAGQPRTLYLDFEKSGATYGGIGWQRIDVPAEMARVCGPKYTAKQLAEWFNSLPTRLKPGQYDVILVDPANDIESGEVDVVKANPAEHGYTKNQFDGSVALLMAAMKAHWKKLLMSFSNVCKTFYFTTHLRDEFKGGKPSGKREPRGKETLAELASLYLWLERLPDDKGNVAAEPSAIVIKQRLADTTINENGELVIRALMPPRIPVATVAAIRGYIANPANYEKLATAERVVEKQATEEEICRLRLAAAEAETRAADSRTNLLDRQQQLAAVRQTAAATAPQSSDRSAIVNQAAAEKRTASVSQAEVDAARAEAEVKLAAAKAEGARLMAAAEGDHATARDVAAEVHDAKTAAPTTNGAATNPRIEQFISLLKKTGYASDPILKRNVDECIESRGAKKFSLLKPDLQMELIVYLNDLVECRRFAGQLSLSDEKESAMLARVGASRIEHLTGPMALMLKDKLLQAVQARNGAATNGQQDQNPTAAAMAAT